eukprot:scaffold145379_cov33-Tisochrysis_lutea.AAC.2
MATRRIDRLQRTKAELRLDPKERLPVGTLTGRWLHRRKQAGNPQGERGGRAKCLPTPWMCPTACPIAPAATTTRAERQAREGTR